MPRVARTFPIGPEGDCAAGHEWDEIDGGVSVCLICGAAKTITITIPKRRKHGLAADGGDLEGEIGRDIASALSRVPGIRVARNNNGTLRDEHGTPVTYGLGKGSADYVGIATYTVEGLRAEGGELIGDCTIGRVLAIEVKRPKKKASPHQQRWLHVMAKRGAIVGVATSVEEALAIVARAGFDVEGARRWYATTLERRRA